MALGGGTFLVQNKVLPGAYINFVSRPRAMGVMGERGVVCMGMELDWGPQEMMTVEAADFQTNAMEVFGFGYSHDKMKDMRELFCGAKTAKIYRINSGTAATAKIGELTVTAKYGGLRGNDLRVVVAENVDEEGMFDVATYMDMEQVDVQTVANIDSLEENKFVKFSGTGALTPTAATPLTGGTTEEVSGSGYTDFLEAAEKEDFNVLAYNGTDEVTKKLFVSFTKRLRDEEGVKFVTVLYDYPQADYEGIISVGTAKELVCWTAGMEAGAAVNESLTNRKYDGEYEVDAKDTKSNFIKGIQAGKFLFYDDGGEVRVLRDINCFTSFESNKNSDFSSNRVVRVLDSIANDVARIFSQYYLGKRSNNADGRNLLKAEIIAYHEQLLQLEAIENFTSEDITVQQGVEKQDVVVYESVQPTDAMEKLYMRVEVV